MAQNEIADRLRIAIDSSGRGVAAFQRDLAARAEEYSEATEKKVPGTSYAAVFRYLKGTYTPSLPLLELAAYTLRVRRDWLISGQGAMTEPEERLRVDREGWSPVEAAIELAAPAIHLQGHLAVNHFKGVLRRWMISCPDDEVTNDQVAQMARILERLVVLPHRIFLRGGRMVEGRPYGAETEGYTYAALSAISLAMPGPGEGVPADEQIAHGLEWLGIPETMEE